MNRAKMILLQIPDVELLRTMSDEQMYRFRGVGPKMLDAIRVLIDPNINLCPHCGKRL